MRRNLRSTRSFCVPMYICTYLSRKLSLYVSIVRPFLTPPHARNINLIFVDLHVQLIKDETNKDLNNISSRSMYYQSREIVSLYSQDFFHGFLQVGTCISGRVITWTDDDTLHLPTGTLHSIVYVGCGGSNDQYLFFPIIGFFVACALLHCN